MKKFLLIIFLLLIITNLHAGSLTNAPLNITEEDGSPNTFPYKLKTTNGTLTDNGDGTASLSITGGSGDVTDVGDCTGGACLDGTSDGGTYIKFYDAQGAGTFITGNLTGARTWTLPDNSGTIALTSDITGGNNWTMAADSGTNQLIGDTAETVTLKGTSAAGISTTVGATNTWTIVQTKADNTTNGYLWSTDRLNFNTAYGWGDHSTAGYWTTSAGKSWTGNDIALTTYTSGSYVASVATTAPLTGGAAGSEGATLTIAIPVASTSANGYLWSTDWNTFNDKQTTIANYVGTVADGTGIDGTASGAGSTYTPTFDATELGALTWSTGAGTNFTWTFDLSGTDVAINWTSAVMNVTGSIQESGINVLNNDEIDASSELLAIMDDETGTGLLVFGTSPTFLTSIAVPQGTAPTVDAAGEIAVDTSDDQLIYYGAAKRVIPYTFYKCAVIENLAAADDNFEIFMANDASTVVSIGAYCRGTCTTPATIVLQDRTGNAMTGTATASTGTGSTTWTAITAGGALTAGEGLAFDVTNAVSPETDEYTICFGVTYDAQ